MRVLAAKPTRLCLNDASEAAALAKFLGTLSARLGARGKTVTLCVNAHGAGFLREPHLQMYLDAGAARLMEMGTYGVGHYSTRAVGLQQRDQLTRRLLGQYPPGRLGLGVATTLHYRQNVSSLR